MSGCNEGKKGSQYNYWQFKKHKYCAKNLKWQKNNLEAHQNKRSYATLLFYPLSFEDFLLKNFFF